jgi:MtN3 and saliva related transmembrane protein
MAEIAGFVAAILTTAAFIPQAIQVYKTKKTDDLSLSMFVMFSVGVFLWLIYGVLILSYAVIFANIATLVLALYILSVKLLNMRKFD